MSSNSSIIDVYRNKILSPSIRSNTSPGQWKDTKEEKEENPQETLREKLGLDDFLSAKVWRASLVELMGTAILVFMTDAISISTFDTIIGGSPTLILSILNGITISLLVFATMPISGGHLIPIVSLSAALMGLISLSRAFLYISSQCIGGILAAITLKLVLNSDTERKYSLGGCTITTVVTGPDGPVTSGLGLTQAFYLEFICCFILLFTLRWIAFDQEQAKSFGKIVVCSAIGLTVGLNIFLSSTVTGVRGYSGAGMSSARCLGPAIVRGGNLWNGHWVFWIAPAMASISFYIFTKIVMGSRTQPDENIDDFKIISIDLSKRGP